MVGRGEPTWGGGLKDTPRTAKRRIGPPNNFFLQNHLFLSQMLLKIYATFIKKSFLFSRNHFVPIIIPSKEKKKCTTKNF